MIKILSDKLDNLRLGSGSKQNDYDLNNLKSHLVSFINSLYKLVQHLLIPMKSVAKDKSARIYRKLVQIMCRMLEIAVLTNILKQKLDYPHNRTHEITDIILDYCSYIHLFKSLKDTLLEINQLLLKYDLTEYTDKLNEINQITDEILILIFELITTLIIKDEIILTEKSFLHTSLDLILNVLNTKNETDI